MKVLGMFVLFARAHMNTGDEGFSFARIVSWALLAIIFSVLGWAFNKARNAELRWREKRKQAKLCKEKSIKEEQTNE